MMSDPSMHGDGPGGHGMPMGGSGDHEKMGGGGYHQMQGPPQQRSAPPSGPPPPHGGYSMDDGMTPSMEMGGGPMTSPPNYNTNLSGFFG